MLDDAEQWAVLYALVSALTRARLPVHQQATDQAWVADDQ